MKSSVQRQMKCNKNDVFVAGIEYQRFGDWCKEENRSTHSVAESFK